VQHRRHHPVALEKQKGPSIGLFNVNHKNDVSAQVKG